MTMGAQVNVDASRYVFYDTRDLSKSDAIHEAATKIADEIMEGIDRLTYSNSIEVATLFITGSVAQLVLIARSFDENLIAPAFRCTLKTVTFDHDIGFLQKYVIPILDS